MPWSGMPSSLVHVTSSDVTQLYSLCHGLASEIFVTLVIAGPTHRFGNSTAVDRVSMYSSACRALARPAYRYGPMMIFSGALVTPSWSLYQPLSLFSSLNAPSISGLAGSIGCAPPPPPPRPPPPPPPPPAAGVSSSPRLMMRKVMLFLRPTESVTTTAGFTPVGSISQMSKRSLMRTDLSPFVQPAMPHALGSSGVDQVSCSKCTPLIGAVRSTVLPVAVL